MGQVPRPKSLPTVALEPGNDLFNNYSLPRSWPSCREKHLLVIYFSYLSIAKNSSSCVTLTIFHLKKIKLGNTGKIMPFEARHRHNPVRCQRQRRWNPPPGQVPVEPGACFSQSPWPYTNRRRSLIIYAPSKDPDGRSVSRSYHTHSYICFFFLSPSQHPAAIQALTFRSNF